MTGAEQLSQAILESGMPFSLASYASIKTVSPDPEVIRPNHDINAQMMGRKGKLSFLIKFINDNAALNKVSVAVGRTFNDNLLASRCPNRADNGWLRMRRSYTLLTSYGCNTMNS